MQNLQSFITRREFHHRIAGAAVLGAAALARQARAQSFPPGKYFDIHTHIGQEWGAKEKLTAKALLAWMDLHEIKSALPQPGRLSHVGARSYLKSRYNFEVFLA